MLKFGYEVFLAAFFQNVFVFFSVGFLVGIVERIVGGECQVDVETGSSIFKIDVFKRFGKSVFVVKSPTCRHAIGIFLIIG